MRNENRPAGNGTALKLASTPHQITPPGALAAVGARRRREAARRIEFGDPWHYPRPGVRGRAEACAHLLAVDLMPVFTVDECRQAWADAGELEREALVTTVRAVTA